MKNIKLFEEFSTQERWKIYAGLGGGFGGAKYVKTITGTKQEAEAEAYQEAISSYESYEGLHGLRTISDIKEEDGVDEEEAEAIYNDERESWLDYWVEEDDDNESE